MSKPVAMIALGGNSLSPKEEIGNINQQFNHTRKALDGIGYFIDKGYNLCINHGNGPQVGNELLRMDLTNSRSSSTTFGSLCSKHTGIHGIYDSTIFTKQIARYASRP